MDELELLGRITVQSTVSSEGSRSYAVGDSQWSTFWRCWRLDDTPETILEGYSLARSPRMCAALVLSTCRRLVAACSRVEPLDCRERVVTWHGGSIFFQVMLLPHPTRRFPRKAELDRPAMQDDYQERLGYLYGRLNYEWLGMPRSSGQLRLGRMRRLSRRMGDPHLGLRIIHVAGTKGKGSTSAMIAAALAASGVRTGLYCSPHLHRLEERFTVDGKPASPAELIELVDVAREAVEQLEREDNPRRSPRSHVFRDHHGDGPAALRPPPGRGRRARGRPGRPARLDERGPAMVSIITSISFDHTRQLGNILASIATEKAGILKRGRPAISGACDAEARTPFGASPASAAACFAKSTRTSGTKTSRRCLRLTRPDRRSGGGANLVPGLGATDACRCSVPTRPTMSPSCWQASIFSPRSSRTSRSRAKTL